MRPTATIDLREWRAAAAKLKETSSRTLVDFTNGQALKVATLAFKRTHFADRAKIERELGAVGRDVSFKQISRGKRKGQYRTVKGGYQLAGENTLAHNILIARRIKTGKWGVEGQSIADKARNLIKARAASTNFIRAGWIPAMDKLWSAVRKKPDKVSNQRSGVRIKGQRKGSALPAVFTLRSQIFAEIENRAMNTIPKFPSVKGNAHGAAIEGLQEAFNEATADMIAELERRLQPDLSAVSAK